MSYFKNVLAISKETASNTWFTNMSKEDQAAYIKEHPDSKYAKGGAVKSEATTKTVQGTKTASSLEKIGIKTFNGGSADGYDAIVLKNKADASKAVAHLKKEGIAFEYSKSEADTIYIKSDNKEQAATSNLDKVFTLTGMNTKQGYSKALDNIITRTRRVLKAAGLSKIKEEDDGVDDPKKMVHYNIVFTGWNIDKLKVSDITKPIKEEFGAVKPKIAVRSWKAQKGYMYEVTFDASIKTISETRK